MSPGENFVVATCIRDQASRSRTRTGLRRTTDQEQDVRDRVVCQKRRAVAAGDNPAQLARQLLLHAGNEMVNDASKLFKS